MPIEDTKDLSEYVYRGLRKPSWADPNSGKLLPVAFYRQKLRDQTYEEGLSILICEGCPDRDDFKRIVPAFPSCGVGSLPVNGISAIQNLSIVTIRDEKGEIRGMPHPEDEMEAHKECAHSLSDMSRLESQWEQA
jgi:hypothetical protein